MVENKKHYRNCNICEAMCGLVIEHKDSQILSIKPDKEDPFSQGHICPKAIALQDFYNDPERLKTPIKRTSSGWIDITWDEAFEEICSKFQQIQNQFGDNALGVYLGNPNAHSLGNAIFLPPFLKSLRTKNRYSSASADQLPHHVASNYMFGSGMLVPIPDIDRTDFMLIVGANPAVSNGSMMTAPKVMSRIKAIQERGGKVIVVDPRKTETAQKADEHFFIRPEKDALLFLAILYTLFEAKNIKLGHLENLIEGISELENCAKDFSPEDVADEVGIEAFHIRRIAEDLANAKSAVCYSRMGASTQSFGGLCQWLTNAINIVTGNFDNPGGAMFPLPAFDLLRKKEKGHPNSYGRYQSRVRKLPFFNGEFPVATLAEEILTPGEGQIKAMLTIAGNPVLSSPGGDKLGEAFANLDYMVSIDIYLNETTKHADIILPGTTGIENPQFDIFFNSFAVRNTVKYSPPLFQKGTEQKADWEIMMELSARMTGIEQQPITPEIILDIELKKGPYGKQGMSLEKLLENPHGIDLGPLQSSLTDRLLTADGKIQLAPQFFLDDIPRLKSQIKQDADNQNYPFQLISRRLVRSHNTWTQNSYRLVKGKNPCTLEINPQDANDLAIVDGQKVLVSSQSGQLEIEVCVSENIKPGVVSLPQGWGHNHKDTVMTTAATQPGVSINDLTNSNRIDTLTGNAAFNGTPVAITVI